MDPKRSIGFEPFLCLWAGLGKGLWSTEVLAGVKECISGIDGPLLWHLYIRPNIRSLDGTVRHSYADVDAGQ